MKVYEKAKENTASVHIENIENDEPYTVIGAKAFLSCKNVYEVKLPDTICEIGAWAFAHMKELKRIIVPANNISIGKDVFLDCDNLKEVVVYPDESGNTGLPSLLASCITVLKSNELLDFKKAVTDNKDWCKLYDETLIKYVCRSDDQGFQPVIVGWFNDEGEEEQLTRYIKKTKSDKINLCFLRLKYDMHSNDNTKETLISYLKNQIKQPDDGSSSWKVIREVLSEDIEYAKLAVTNDLLDNELILDLIKYINNVNASTEIVAYLVQSLDGENKSIDEQFEL